MRKILFAVLVMVLAFQVQAFAGTQKIAVANMGKLMKDSEIGQAAQKELEKKFSSAKDQLKAKQTELENLKKELQKQSLVLSLEAKQDKELEFKRKVRDYQDLAQATKRRMGIEQNKVAGPVLKLLKSVIDDYGKKKGYSAIFDEGTSGLLYVDSSMNVTNEIMVEMNKAYRAQKK